MSIVIPTFDNHRLLRERALPSALTQTYERIEVIVVGDAAPDDARLAVEDHGDPRASFHNLPYRGPYPDDPAARWLVAGVPPYNAGVDGPPGAGSRPWMTTTPSTPPRRDPLAHARDQRAELAYGALASIPPTARTASWGGSRPSTASSASRQPSTTPVSADLPARARRRGLGQPYDWDCAGASCARACGSRCWTGGRPLLPLQVPAAAPGDGAQVRGGRGSEWELRGKLGRRAETERETGRGWEVDAVARSYLRRWPAFLGAGGNGPLGVSYEVPEDAKIQRDDPPAQNTVLAFGYALAHAARGTNGVSVLDWGGRRHYHELGRRLLDGVAFDYHCRELPAVCAAGACRRV